MPILLNPPEKGKLVLANKFNSKLMAKAREIYQPKGEPGPVMTWQSAISKAVKLSQKKKKKRSNPMEYHSYGPRSPYLANPLFTKPFMEVASDIYSRYGKSKSKLGKELGQKTVEKMKSPTAWRMAVALAARKHEGMISVPKEIYYGGAQETYWSDPESYYKSLGKKGYLPWQKKKGDRPAGYKKITRQRYTRKPFVTTWRGKDKPETIPAMTILGGKYLSVRGGKGSYGKAIKDILDMVKRADTRHEFFDGKNWIKPPSKEILQKALMKEGLTGKRPSSSVIVKEKKGVKKSRAVTRRDLVQRLKAIGKDALKEKDVKKKKTAHAKAVRKWAKPLANLRKGAKLTSIAKAFREGAKTRAQRAEIREDILEKLPANMRGYVPASNPYYEEPYMENPISPWAGFALGASEGATAGILSNQLAGWSAKAMGLRAMWLNKAFPENFKTVAYKDADSSKSMIRNYYMAVAGTEGAVGLGVWGLWHWGARLLTGVAPYSGEMVGKEYVPADYLRPRAISIGSLIGVAMRAVNTLLKMNEVTSYQQLWDKEAPTVTVTQVKEIQKRIVAADAALKLPAGVSDYVTTRREPQAVSDYVTTLREPQSVSDYITTKKSVPSLKTEDISEWIVSQKQHVPLSARLRESMNEDFEM